MGTPNRGKIISEAAFRRLWDDETLSMCDIGRVIGISGLAVRHRAKARGFPQRKIRHPRHNQKKVDDVRLRELWETAMTTQEMADVFGVHVGQIKRAKHRLGLPDRPRGGVRGGKAMKIDGSGEELLEMWREGVKLAEIASHFAMSRTGVKSAISYLGGAPRKRGGDQVSITVDEFREIMLAKRMAQAAARRQAAVISHDMADYVGDKRGGQRQVGSHQARMIA